MTKSASGRPTNALVSILMCAHCQQREQRNETMLFPNRSIFIIAQVYPMSVSNCFCRSNSPLFFIYPLDAHAQQPQTIAESPIDGTDSRSLLVDSSVLFSFRCAARRNAPALASRRSAPPSSVRTSSGQDASARQRSAGSKTRSSNAIVQ